RVGSVFLLSPTYPTPPLFPPTPFTSTAHPPLSPPPSPLIPPWQHKDQVAHLQSTLSSLRHALDKERDTNTRLLRTLQEAEKAAVEVATDAQGMSTHAHKLMRLAAGHKDRLGKAAAAAAAVSAGNAAAAAAAAAVAAAAGGGAGNGK
ncbi:unnamed protein product, partial [Closterium sp. NIES-54]